MFVLKESYEFDWPIELCVGGQVQRFVATFRTLPQDESEALALAVGEASKKVRAAVTEGESAEEIANLQREVRDLDDKLVLRAMTGWHDVSDESGDPIAFTEAAAKRALAIPAFKLAISDAYGEATQGRGAVAKNFEPSPEPGPPAEPATETPSPTS